MPSKRTAPTSAAQGARSGSTSESDSMHENGPGGSMVDEAKDKVQELASQAQDKAGEQLHAGVSKGKNRAAETLGAVAQSLLVSGQQLRQQDRNTVGGLVENAASRVEQWANYLQNTDARQMADRVENFARREPAIFLGGAFAFGLLGARFLKSSRRGEESQHARSGMYRGQQGRQFSRPRSTMSDREVPISRTPYESDALGRSMSSANESGTSRTRETIPGQTTGHTTGQSTGQTTGQMGGGSPTGGKGTEGY